MQFKILAVCAILALSACDVSRKDARPQDAPTADAPASAPANALDTPWIPIANTTEGGQVQYRKDSITPDAAAATTDVTIKIIYPDYQTWTIDLPAYVEQKTFNEEQVTLRFDCAAQRFAIVRRQALDKNGYVKETIETPPGAKDTFKTIVKGGVADVAVSRACPAKP